MSDRLILSLYALAFRLYPSEFRGRFGEETLQFVRDRLADEHTPIARMRLCTDFVFDLITSVARERKAAFFAVPSRSWETIGAPALDLFNDSQLRPHFLSCLLLLSLLAGFVTSKRLEGTGHCSPSELNSTSHMVPEWMRSGPSTVLAQAILPQGSLTDAEQKRVVEAINSNLERHYISPSVGRQMIQALHAHLNRGDYRNVVEGPAFATLLTQEMQAVSHDGHILVRYSPERLPEAPPQPTPEDLARLRAQMERSHCTVERAEILPDHLAYLKINEFPDPSLCETSVRQTMSRLNGASAIVFDLRDNHGGHPDMVALVASYLFTKPTHMISVVDRNEHVVVDSWTRSPVPGNSLADVPAYILTSHGTFSGAEEFVSTLKSLHRATVIGETTGGGAHMASIHRLDEHFGMAVPDGRPMDPVTHQDWEGTGVSPDVPVGREAALDTALKLAREKTSGKNLPFGERRS